MAFPSCLMAPLTHSKLTSLTIPDESLLLHLFINLAFPAFENLTVSNSQTNDLILPDSDILSALQHITGHSTHLTSPRRAMMHLSNDGMFALLCGLPSLRDLYIAPHPAYRSGAFLSQLLEQSKVQAVLLRLVSFTVHIAGWECTPEWLDELDVDAFKAFVGDSRRSGEGRKPRPDAVEEGGCEQLRCAILNLQDNVVYLYLDGTFDDFSEFISIGWDEHF
ncbi:hypothetical protein BKA70DRAFT_1529140 [Coprinopsis sp. MPI-PUGE-AT-0042]|nr:hypothetical protein BKA70DRAFT_1529140 [Coprinopsis sp. MPI-PUGE-AT-0042]